MKKELNWLNKLTIVQVESKPLFNTALKNFINTNLLLNNVFIESLNKIYLFYISEIKTYQILVADDSFDISYLECFRTNCTSNKNILFVCKNYCILYKNKKPYFFQKNTQQINKDEINRFIESKLSISIDEIKEFDDESLFSLIDNYKKSNFKAILKDFNKTKDGFLAIYIVYIFTILAFLFYFTIYGSVNSKVIVKPKEITYPKMQYFSKDYNLILENLNKNKLKVKSFLYENKKIKLLFTSTNKENIYRFLIEFKNSINNSAVTYIKEKKLYECEIGIKSL